MPGFRPTLWPTLFTLPALAILIALGTWQLERLEWKTALIAEREAAVAAAPVALPEDPAAIAGMGFRRVRARGTFLHDRAVLLSARYHQRQPGYDLLVPLRLENGKVLMVNRGWIPLKAAAPAARAAFEPRGEVAVTGFLRAAPRKGWFTPESVPEEGEWYWYDLPAMADHLGLPLLPAVLEAAPDSGPDSGPDSSPGPLPVALTPVVELPNNHLQYALTWYGLAVALVVIYVAYHRKEQAP